MFTEGVPVCSRCTQDPESVEKLQQHAVVLKLSENPLKARARGARGAGKISLFTPLDPTTDFSVQGSLKRKVNTPSQYGATEDVKHVERPSRHPTWMKLLPSNVNSAIRPPTHSVIERRVAFPYFQSTRFSTPFMTPPEYPTDDPGYALAVSTAVQGIPEAWSLHPIPTPARSFSSISIPHSYANIDRHKRLRQSPSTTETVQISRNVAHSYTTDEKMMSEQQLSVPDCKRQRRSSACPRISRKLKLRTRDSPTQIDAACRRRTHTPIPDQTISPAKPPFYKELSGFFATRAGKWILPSRVSESRESMDGQRNTVPCAHCGADVDEWRQHHSSRKAHSILGEVLCRSCRVSSALPGGWSEQKH